MEKTLLKPANALFPVPAVLVTSRLGDGEPNIIAIAWTGVMNNNPPMVYVAVQPSRHSHRLIKESGEYVINIPSAEMAKIVDYCGMVSGRDVNKFKETGLTPLAASKVKAPLIKECPVNLECKVRNVVSLDTHDVFIGEVVAVHADKDVLSEKGSPDFEKINPCAFCMGEYWGLKERIGSYGFSKRKD